jgi:serine/threonine protein kinase
MPFATTFTKAMTTTLTKTGKRTWKFQTNGKPIPNQWQTPRSSLTGSVVNRAFLFGPQVFIFVCYVSVLVLPMTTIYRRPAMRNYALFWAANYGLGTLGLSMLRYPETPWGKSFSCLYILQDGILFHLIKPFIVYSTLLRDSEYWQGLCMVQKNFSYFNKAEETQYNDLQSPLLGVSLSRNAARHAASFADSFAVQAATHAIGPDGQTQGGQQQRQGNRRSFNSMFKGRKHGRAASDDYAKTNTAGRGARRLQSNGGQRNNFSNSAPGGAFTYIPNSIRNSLARVMDIINPDVKDTSYLLNFAFLEVDDKALLGAGGTCKVYKGKYKKEPVAVKIVYCTEITPKVLQNFCREAALHASLQHPNVVHMVGVCMLPPAVGIVLELCNMGSLYDLIHGPSWGRLSHADRLTLAVGCARGLAYLHSMRIVHLDVKSMNYLVHRVEVPLEEPYIPPKQQQPQSQQQDQQDWQQRRRQQNLPPLAPPLQLPPGSHQSQQDSDVNSVGSGRFASSLNSDGNDRNSDANSEDSSGGLERALGNSARIGRLGQALLSGTTGRQGILPPNRQRAGTDNSSRSTRSTSTSSTASVSQRYHYQVKLADLELSRRALPPLPEEDMEEAIERSFSQSFSQSFAVPDDEEDSDGEGGGGGMQGVSIPDICAAAARLSESTGGYDDEDVAGSVTEDDCSLPRGALQRDHECSDLGQGRRERRRLAQKDSGQNTQAQTWKEQHGGSWKSPAKRLEAAPADRRARFKSLSSAEDKQVGAEEDATQQEHEGLLCIDGQDLEGQEAEGQEAEGQEAEDGGSKERSDSVEHWHREPHRTPDVTRAIARAGHEDHDEDWGDKQSERSTSIASNASAASAASGRIAMENEIFKSSDSDASMLSDRSYRSTQSARSISQASQGSIPSSSIGSAIGGIAASISDSFSDIGHKGVKPRKRQRSWDGLGPETVNWTAPEVMRISLASCEMPSARRADRSFSYFASTGQISDKSDVYSLAMVLFEVPCISTALLTCVCDVIVVAGFHRDGSLRPCRSP